MNSGPGSSSSRRAFRGTFKKYYNFAMRLSFRLVVFMGYKISHLSTKKDLEVNMNQIDGSLLRTGTRGTGIWWREPTEAWMQQEKKGMSTFFRFRIRKKQISKRAPGSWMRLESLNYFKYLRPGEVPGPKKVAWIDVIDDVDPNIMRHRLTPWSF